MKPDTMYTPGPRTTSTIEHLLIEARLLDETGEAKNAAIPAGEAVARAARERIAAEGLTPAWEV